MTMTTASAIRSELIKALQADLIGPFLSDEHPGVGDEVLPLPPSRWYLMGFLAPRGGRVPDKDDADSEDEGLAAGGESKAEDAGTTEPEAKRRQQFPASMGLMHAKCVAVDSRFAFISSANFTLRAQDRNIETGVLIDDPLFAQQLDRQWMSLVQGGFVLRGMVG